MVLNKWYTAEAAGCAGGTGLCGEPERDSSTWASGDYKWRLRDYGSYGYGAYTAFKALRFERSLLHADDRR